SAWLSKALTSHRVNLKALMRERAAGASQLHEALENIEPERRAILQSNSVGLLCVLTLDRPPIIQKTPPERGFQVGGTPSQKGRPLSRRNASRSKLPLSPLFGARCVSPTIGRSPPCSNISTKIGSVVTRRASARSRTSG